MTPRTAIILVAVAGAVAAFYFMHGATGASSSAATTPGTASKARQPAIEVSTPISPVPQAPLGFGGMGKMGALSMNRNAGFGMFM